MNATHLPTALATPTTPDFHLLGGGTVYLLQPNTDAGRDWIREYIFEEAQTLGKSVAVEHRFIHDIIDGVRTRGLVIQNT